MHDPQHFKSYLGKEEQYHNFLEFFRCEIASKGHEAVVLQYLLAGNDQADDLLVRCFGGSLIAWYGLWHANAFIVRFSASPYPPGLCP